MIKIYAEFLIFSILIIYFGFKLSYYGQLITERGFLSKALFGVIFLAIVTSLPELITSISSVTAVDAPNMAVSDAIGSILFNVIILAFLDFIQGEGAILSVSNRSHILTAAATIVMLGLIALSIIYRTVTGFSPGLFHISCESIILIMIYIFLIRSLYCHGQNDSDLKDKNPEKIYSLWIKFGIASLIVIISGYFLAKLGKEIVSLTGMSETYVGLIFLAVVTSLPELIVSTSALKLGSVDMAVGNILGSNFFDTVIVPTTDICYLKNQLLSTISISHTFTITLCSVFLSIIICGLTYRSKKSFLKLGWDTIAIIIILILSLFFFYYIK